MSKRRTLVLACALLAALLAADLLRRVPSGDEGASDAPAHRGERPPNVIIYLVDTLRADHLGLYGYERETSPVLDRWADESVVFDRAYAPSSWTRPSTVSLLSGLDPIRHGVEDRLDVIPDDVRLLSEHLQSSGYATFAAVTNPNVLPEWGFDQGFDVYRDLEAAGLGTRADAVSDYVAAKMAEFAGRQPFFLYLHLLDPHAPFEPPSPYDERFPRSPALPADLSIGRYDGEVAFVDAEFGRLLDTLDAHGMDDDTLVIFLADHGEELMDHGSMGHGTTLFEEVVRIPLVMRLPRGAHAGSRIASRVSLIDVLPTVLSLVGLPPDPDVDGRDLSPLLDSKDDRFDDRELFLSLYTTGTRSHMVRGVLSGSHKYLRRTRPNESEALFDLERDPGEFEDRDQLDSDVRQSMAASLDTHLASKSSGVHLRMVSSPASEPVGCEAVLRTTGRFVEVSEIRLEAEDRIELAEDGRTLRLHCRLENRTRSFAEGERLIPDEDGVVFQVDPTDAPVVVQRLALANGGALPFRVGETRALEAVPFTFDATLPNAWVRDVGEMLRDADSMHTAAEAYLAVIRFAATHGELSERLRDRLRALGYLEDNESESPSNQEP